MNIGYIILICVAAFFIIGFIGLSQNKRKRKEKLLKLGLSEIDFLKSGGYKCGHPELDKPEEKTELVVKEDNINIYSIDNNTVPTFKANIPINKIKNILIEDASTVEKRITAARLFAVGIFAFAWKKKKVNEMSYLIIEWNDGKYDHETIFEFTGTGSVQKSNEVRNKLIKLTK